MTVTDPVMVPIPISEFINGTTVPVNLYIKLGESKFVMIAKAGQKTQKDRLEVFENKTVEYLWVKKNEYGKLIKNNLIIAGIVVGQKNLDLKQKSVILSNAAAAVFRDLDSVGLSFEAYSHSKQIVDATVALSENHSDLSEIFSSLNDCSDVLLKHSMAVCSVSVLIAHAMKWDSRATIEKLALGALLHDIGKKTLPPDLLTKPKAKMSFEETQIYEQHPYRGMKMLVELGIVPDDVISIVYEHHENSIGMGYPRKLRNLKIHPLARIVALADEFVNMTLANPNCPNPKSPREALMVIELTLGQPFNKDCFRALCSVINKEILRKAG